MKESTARHFSPSNLNRESGIVKQFNEVQGYGYIRRAAGADIYVHYRDIDTEGGYRMLEPGQRVSFETAEGVKGLQAKKVRVE
jgi:CspA family cold shock protein